MEKIYLDIGNSHYKMAVYSNGRWSVVAQGKIDQASEFRSNVQKNDTGNKWIITSVRMDVLEVLKSFLPAERVRIIDNHDIDPDKIDYRTPHTLGLDRFLAAYAAFHESKKSVMIIDAGSAITIDMMNDKGVFMGGVIIPGLRIQKQAVTDYLPELPVIENVIPGNWPGKSSKECLEWGIHGSLQFALNGFIDRYSETHSDMDLYLTGGDSEFVGELIEKKSELLIRNHLVFEGMRLLSE